MSKKNVTLKVNAETEDAKNKLESFTKKIEKLGSSKITSAVSTLSNAFMGPIGVLKTLKETFDKVKDSLNECVELYNIQADAEARLEVAAKNNPYLLSSNVQALKEYASELQGIGEIGDEALLPMMANLAASGRTQEQIQNIMRAALEASATGMISMDSAVKSLNGSLNGSLGSLGELLPGLKNLTKEELESGKAIEEVQKAYNGMSEATANSTVQMNNALGDLKEVLGGLMNPLKDKASKVAKSFFEGVTNILQKAGKEVDHFKERLGILAETEDSSEIGAIQSRIDFLEKESERLEKMKLVATQGEETLAEKEKGTLQELQTELDSVSGKYSQMRQVATNAYNAIYQESQKNIANAWDMDTSELEQAQARIQKANYDYLAETKRLEIEKEKEISVVNQKIDAQKNIVKEVNKEARELTHEFQREFLGSVDGVNTELDKTKQLLNEAKLKLTELQGTNQRQTEADIAKKVNEMYLANHQARQKEITAINQKYTLMEKEGKQIDEVAKKQEILNAYERAYLQLINSVDESDPTIKITANNSRAINDLKEIVALAKEIEQEVPIEIKPTLSNSNSFSDEISRQLKKINVDIDFQTNKEDLDFSEIVEDLRDLQNKLKPEIEKVKTQLDEMSKAGINTDEQKKQYDELLKLYDDYAKKREEIEKQVTELTKEEGEEQKALIENVLNNISTGLNSLANAINTMTNMFIQQAEAESQVKIAELDKQYDEGLISLDDYEKKKKSIEKKAAQEKYKMEMWQWSASLLQIGVDTARAIMSAMATDGIAGPILASAAGILGAAQLTAAIANKPIPPQFATGGFLVGSSTRGDKIPFKGNAGEAILNPAEMRTFMKMANGEWKGSERQTSLNVDIKNYMGESANVSTQMNNGELEIIIQSVVNNGLNNGTFDSGILSAQNRQNGISYM